jgi:hypothetical protein
MIGGSAEALYRRAVRATLNPRQGVKSAAALARRMWRDYSVNAAESRFDALANSLVADLERPTQPKAIVAFCDSGFTVLRGLHALAGRALCRMDALPLYLMSELTPPSLGDPSLAAIENALLRSDRNTYRRRGSDGSLRYEWTVDWHRRVCVAEGINFAPAILGMLRRNHKRYEIDFDLPSIRQEAEVMRRSADATLGLCLDLEDYVKRVRVPVRFAAGELNYVPGGVFNLYCAERGKAYGMEFVDFGIAYSHYFKPGAMLGREYNIRNVTHDRAHGRLDVPRNQFDDWLSRQHDIQGTIDHVGQIIRQSRTAREALAPEASKLLQRIAEHRDRGGKVACVFGHLTFDTGLRDDGVIHRDMTDWLNDTLSHLAGTDVLVLVKPHVNEGRYKGNREPGQFFAELIHVPLADNIVVLDPLWFNAHDLFAHIDLGLVWRSTVAIELAIAGIPTIVSGRECYYGQALDLHRPTSLQHYHELLATPGSLAVPGDLPTRAAMLLRYIQTEKMVTLPYFRPKGENGSLTPAWKEDELTAFGRRGDPKIDRFCEELLA